MKGSQHHALQFNITACVSLCIPHVLQQKPVGLRATKYKLKGLLGILQRCSEENCILMEYRHLFDNNRTLSEFIKEGTQQHIFFIVDITRDPKGGKSLNGICDKQVCRK